MERNLFGEEVNRKERSLIKERIESYGIESLFNFEAISIITGIKEEVIKAFKSLADLEERLPMIDCTSTQRTKLQALFTVAKRYSKESRGEVKTVRSPQDVYNLVADDLKNCKREYFKIIMLDTKCQVIEIEQISEGSLNSSIVHPMQVFRTAALYAANTIILCHNHPSGNPAPSQEDVNITKRLVEAGKLMGIEVIDHIIIGDRFTSLKEEGII